MIDTVILFAVLVCGVVGVVTYFVAKWLVIILWVFARSISYTRWSLAVISTEGRKLWIQKPWYERWWIIFKHVFTSLPTVLGGTITSGDNYWDGINDHKP